MYTEFDRRTRLAEIEAEFYRPRERDGVRVREPGLLERGVMALVTALRSALVRRGTKSEQAPVAVQHGGDHVVGSRTRQA
jgi:hypothetical protein